MLLCNVSKQERIKERERVTYASATVTAHLLQYGQNPKPLL